MFGQPLPQSLQSHLTNEQWTTLQSSNLRWHKHEVAPYQSRFFNVFAPTSTPLIISDINHSTVDNINASSFEKPLGMRSVTAHANTTFLYHPVRPETRIGWGLVSSASLYGLIGAMAALLIVTWASALFQWQLSARAAILSTLLVVTPFVAVDINLMVLALIVAIASQRWSALALLPVMAAALYYIPAMAIGWLAFAIMPITLLMVADIEQKLISRFGFLIITVLLLLTPVRHELTLQYQLMLIILWQLGVVALPIAELVAVNATLTKRKLALENDAKKSIDEKTADLEQQVKQLQDQNKLLGEKSWVDPLTGLRNRLYFDQRYKSETASCAREDSELSLLIVDVDHFKKINDNYGHPVGDKVLKEVSKRLYNSLRRPSDSLCRIGGEEFAVLLPKTDIQGAQHIAENALKAVSRTPIVIDKGTELDLTISIGLANSKQLVGHGVSALLNHADSALYQAKNNGRNRVERGTGHRKLTKA